MASILFSKTTAYLYGNKWMTSVEISIIFHTHTENGDNHWIWTDRKRKLSFLKWMESESEWPVIVTGFCGHCLHLHTYVFVRTCSVPFQIRTRSKLGVTCIAMTPNYRDNYAYSRFCATAISIRSVNVVTMWLWPAIVRNFGIKINAADEIGTEFTYSNLFHWLVSIMAEGSISELEKVKREIRSILTSSSGNSLTMRQLSNDYKSFIGRDIPFAALGFTTLTSFLNTLTDTVFLDKNAFPRGANVRLVPSNESAHIQELVNDQRKNRKTPSNRSKVQPMQMRR